MERMTVLERDIDRVAQYWQGRKAQFLDEVVDEFAAIVRPYMMFEDWVAEDEVVLMNLGMTEWLLFERPMRDGKTPLELFIDEPPAGTPKAVIDRLRQVAATQFFSRFAILRKDAAKGVASLCDTRSDTCYDVLDRHLCGVDRWRDGVIAERIAYVDGVWQLVGRMHLYDVAGPKPLGPQVPGEIHPEDLPRESYWEGVGFYLRLLRDCIGMDGRFRSSMRIREMGKGGRAAAA